MITCHHNPHLKDIRRLAAPRARASGRFVAEGEDLLAAADAAGWAPVERSSRPAVDVEAPRSRRLARSRALGSGTRVLAVYEERWAPRADRAAAASRCGASATRATSARSLRSRARLRRGERRARPGLRRPVRARRRCGRRWAPSSRCPSRGSRRSRSCPAPRDRARAARRARARCEGRREGTLLVGAERDGLPPTSLAAVRRGRAHPDRRASR